MSVKNWLVGSMVLAALGLAALPVLARQQQQTGSGSGQQTSDPVADAARKAREQQKTAPKPKKVYTDDDVKPATPADTAASAQPGGAQAAADNGQGAANGTGAGKNDPATVWKKRFQDQRDKITAAEKELDILQREGDKAQLQYYNDPQKALTEQYSRKDINDKNAKIEAKQQEIANLKQQLSDLEDELRKSGGDPGWAR